MPDPLEQLPTLGEFVERAMRQYGAVPKVTEVSVTGPRGEVRFKYLEREHQGEKLIAPLPDIQEHEFLAPSVLRQLCARLNIPPGDFGFHLG